MVFDIRKAISKFSSRAQKQEKGNKLVTPTREESNGPISVAVKREGNVFTTTNTSAATHQAGRQKNRDGKVVKSVKFVDCDCDRNVKVSPYGIAYSAPTTATKSVSSSTSTLTLSSEEDPLAPRSPNSTLGSAANENTANTQFRLPAPQGLHSRNLSYGTIYNASRTASYREYPPCSKDDRSNAKATIAGKGNASRGASEKPGRSMPHIFGLGGCNYGHGNIINGRKSLKSVRVNTSEFSRERDNAGKGKQGSLASAASSSGACTVDELKNMGNDEYKKGKFKDAISFYDKAIGMNPRNAACHHNKAAALACLGRIKDAVVGCLAAVNCDPSYFRAHYRLGTLYTRLGQVEAAKKHFRISGHGHNSEAVQRMLVVDGYLMSMKEALKIKDWERVLAESSKAVEAGADACDEAIAAKAEALLKLHKPNEALEILMARKSAGDRKPGSACSRLLLLETQIYLYLGRFEEAVRSAEQAANTEFDSDSLLQLKKAWGAADSHRAGNEYYKAGKFSEACAMYAQGLQYIPTNVFLLFKRATCRIWIGHLEKAIEDLNAALKSHPGHTEALLQRAQAFAKLGRWEDAQGDYLVLRKQYPMDHAISKSLLQVQMELKRKKMPFKHTKI